MDHCFDLYLLSAVACQLSECLCKEELEVLSASLKSLGEMLDLSVAQKARANCCKDCQKDCQKADKE